MTDPRSSELLAAADRVRDATTRSSAALAPARTEEPVRTPAEKSEPHPAHRTAHELDWRAQAAARAARLAEQEAEAERTDQALANLPRRRGPAPRR